MGPEEQRAETRMEGLAHKQTEQKDGKEIDETETEGKTKIGCKITLDFFLFKIEIQWILFII